MEIRPILSALLRNKTAPLLVAIQVAISLAILANALYIVNLRLGAAARPSGIADEANVGYLMSSPVDKPSHQDAMALQQRELEIVRAVPGVVSATWASQMPLSRSGSSSSVRVDLKSNQEAAQPSTYFGGAGLVETLGLQLVEGRNLNDGDMVEIDPDVDDGRTRFPRTVIITKALGKTLFPDADRYLGKVFYFGMGDDANPVRVVGVVERLQSPSASTAARGEHSVILPLRISLRHWRVVVRSEPGRLDAVLAAAEEALRKQSMLPVRYDARSTTRDRVNRYRNEKAMAWMLIAVCGLLLLVTASGIVGMTMLRVAQRRKQIGVRRALGARWRDILRYFLTENFLITSAGIAAGLVAAVAINQLLISHLELSRLPLAYLGAGAAALWLLGLAAVAGPASRAANIPPATATRSV